VVGFGEEENDQVGQSSCGPNPAGGEVDQDQALKTSSYGEVSKLTFLPASPMLADATLINDIRTFTSSLTLYPYHKILK
jgi:nardilysin